MTYVRGQATDYEEWVRLGAKGWDFETVLSAFKRVERNAGLLSVMDQV